MTKGRINKRGKIKTCALCDEDTDDFVKAHIPRKEGRKGYWVHPECELTLNYFVSPRDQELITLEDARWIVTNRIEIKKDPLKLMYYAEDNYIIR